MILARSFFGRVNFTGFACGGLRSVFLSGGFVLSSLLLDWSYTGLGSYFWSTPGRIPVALERSNRIAYGAIGFGVTILCIAYYIYATADV